MKGGRSLKADDHALLEALLRDIGPRLLAFVRRAFGARLEPEEIVAETFFRAAANIDGVRACARPELYLFTITRNLCRDGLRRRRPELCSDEALDRSIESPSPAEALCNRERGEMLLEALASLSEAQREVVVLRLSSELKFEQIAELLEVPLGTVMSRMHAGVQRLRSRVGFAHER